MICIPDQSLFNGYLLRAEKSYSDFCIACEELRSYNDGSDEYIKDLYRAFVANYNVVVRLEFLIEDFRSEYNATSIKRFEHLKRCKSRSHLVYQRWLDFCKNIPDEKFADDLPF